MNKLFTILLALIISLPAINAKPKKDYNGAKYFTWVDYSEAKDWDKYFADLNDVGIEGILMNSSAEGYEKVIAIAKKYGIEVHAWLWIVNNGGLANEHPEWLDYNAKGESLKDVKAYVDYYKFLNPAIPEARKAIVSGVEKIAKIDGIKSISLDYCRYVDAILPTSLWAKYGIKQDRIYPEWDYGYHPEMIAQFMSKYGYDPSKLEDPTTDKKWLDFRCDVLNDMVDSLRIVVQGHGKLLSASPFPTPKMSKHMVRQAWGDWKLDIAFPMLYSGFYYGDLKWIADNVKECRKDMYKDAELFYGFYAGDFGEEGGVNLTDALNAAYKSGATGFSVFTFDGMNPEQRAELKRFIEIRKNKK